MTTINFSALQSTPRLLLEATLKPAQGDRFQPTGFADLGAARYTLADGKTDMLLVESAQSVANRLEAAIWDEGTDNLIKALQGLPYVRVNVTGKNGPLGATTTLHEPHRLNSGYIWTIKGDAALEKFKLDLAEAVGIKARKGTKLKGEPAENDQPAGILDMRKIARGLFKYDPNTVVHGVFLEKIDGRMRLSRALSGFIEARNVRIAESGGVKTDHVDPKGDPKPDFGMVPFHRTEFVAESITAYFNLDVALLRGYGLGEAATNLLIALSLLKVRRFLDTGLRLRTACDLDVAGEVRVARPAEFVLPATSDLEAAMPAYIAACKTMFVEPAVTVVSGSYEKKKGKKGEEGDPAADAQGAD